LLGIIHTETEDFRTYAGKKKKITVRHSKQALVKQYYCSKKYSGQYSGKLMELKNVPHLLDEVKTLAAAFFIEHEPLLKQLITTSSRALEQGHTLFFFGNGGSASQAQHLAAELVNRFLFNRKPLAAIALTCDSSVLTSIANDFDFRDIFRRQLQALGKPGDMAIGLSTSGASENISLALEYAGKAGLITAGFLGNDGGSCKNHCDFPLTVRSSNTPRIQEVHLLLGHILCEQIEREVCTGSC